MQKNEIMIIFSSGTRLLGKRLPIITDSGLHFTKNMAECRVSKPSQNMSVPPILSLLSSIFLET